jgi:hypothetical protein
MRAGILRSVDKLFVVAPSDEEPQPGFALAFTSRSRFVRQGIQRRHKGKEVQFHFTFVPAPAVRRKPLSRSCWNSTVSSAIRSEGPGIALLFGESKRLEDEFFVLFSMLFHPFIPRLLPGQLATVLAFDPFVFSDLFLNEVSDPVKWIR